MIRRPPRSTRTDTLFPYTTLFRSKRVLTVGTDCALGKKYTALALTTTLRARGIDAERSEEHTSELQSLMRISFAVLGLIKKNQLEITNDSGDITDLLPNFLVQKTILNHWCSISLLRNSKDTN